MPNAMPTEVPTSLSVLKAYSSLFTVSRISTHRYVATMDPRLLCFNFFCFISIEFAENVIITDKKTGLATGELDEGIPHVFQCNVTDVAPAQNVTLTWHIGNRTVHTADPFSNSREPIDVASQFEYTPRSEDNGLYIRCELEFKLGPVGPKNLTQSSSRFLLRIRCKYGDSFYILYFKCYF